MEEMVRQMPRMYNQAVEEYKALRKEVNALKAENAALKKTSEDQNMRIFALDALRETHESETARLEEEKRNADMLVAELRRKNEQLSIRADELEKDVAKKRKIDNETVDATLTKKRRELVKEKHDLSSAITLRSQHQSIGESSKNNSKINRDHREHFEDNFVDQTKEPNKRRIIDLTETASNDEYEYDAQEEDDDDDDVVQCFGRRHRRLRQASIFKNDHSDSQLSGLFSSHGTPRQTSFQASTKSKPMTLQQRDFVTALLEQSAGKSSAEPFLQPVNPEAEDIVDYYDVVEHPMDLTKIQLKHIQRKYAALQDFKNDFYLMITNTRLYNGDSHRITKIGFDLLDSFERRMSQCPGAD